MPISPSYPGVYIEEKSSGVRTIIGVPTSITAFIGRAFKGPTDADGPVTINSYGDYERIFGGLSLLSPMSYAVRDFYRNGGSQAIIVGLYKKKGADPEKSTISIEPGLVLEAAYPGSWSKSLRARVDTDVSQAVADRYGLAIGKLFNLTICDTKTGTIEQFRNLTIDDSPTRADLVLKNQSELVRVKTLLMPNAHTTDPAAKKTIWNDDNCSDGVNIEGTDGDTIEESCFTGAGCQAGKKGLYALDNADLFNLLCIPPYYFDGGEVKAELIGDAAAYCESRRAMLIVDPPKAWTSKALVTADKSNLAGAIGTSSKNAALFFPRVKETNPLHDNQVEDFMPCGIVAGIFTKTDTQRGVWKAPAGLDTTITGITGFSVPLTDAENGELNPLGINCLRVKPGSGPVVWGSRTLQGDDRLASEWKYIPVRRTALFLEESLYRSTQWVVFEPNDEPLWAQIRLNIGAFMHDLFIKGAFKGITPREAYYVKCDRNTTTQNDIDKGIVNIEVGFAPLRPAEFVVIRLQQVAGQIQT
jgi:phage tail sheath protein FI